VKFLDAGVFLKHAKKQFCEELIWWARNHENLNIFAELDSINQIH
jgi:hypothetical protein